MDYFKNTYEYRWSNIEDITSFKMYHNAAEKFVLTFKTPVLSCYGCYSSYTWVKLFEMNVITRIYRTQTQKVEQLSSGMYRYKDVEGSRVLVGEYRSGPTSIPSVSNDVYYASGNKAYLRTISSASETEGSKATKWSDYYSISNILAEVQAENYQTITFEDVALTNSEIDSGLGFKYEIECFANPINSNAMFGSYTATHSGTYTTPLIGLITTFKYSWSISGYSTLVDPSSCKITTTIYHQDTSITENGGPLITKGVKYSAYQLFRKALLTCDTYIVENGVTCLDEYNKDGEKLDSLKYPIILNENWINRLQVAKINETIFQCNNLWEVFLQIGYYLHAIPYLEFAKDGTDRFELNFKQLGKSGIDNNNNQNITVFNSQNLSEYFTQYDSYVTNLFSPQNEIEEWIVPKTSDSSYLVSNDTAELHVTYPITELLAFDIAIGDNEFKPALDYIFEKSIYDILSNDDPYVVFPSKGAAVYYNLGDNKICGLNFVPPSKNNNLPMALKRILELLWQGTDINADKIKFNNLKFHIKYKTQDSSRLNQFRPDLERFLKNSSFEKYPHHEQFFGQQDKIIDSERFSANLFGKLIRVGNGVYQRQEYVDRLPEKKSGELYEIDGEPYYVTACENEEYPEAIFQKVTYSKNFNQLSNIVTIPSEPRFYEVSERSKIRREIRLMDFFTLSTNRNNQNFINPNPVFLNQSKWKDFIKNIIFNISDYSLPNYAWNRFCVDELREHPYPSNQMFPSSLLDRSGLTITPNQPNSYSDVIVPILHYPLHDGIVFSWEMVDNFKAGDFIDDHIYYNESNTTEDNAYLSMQPMRYVDIYGRADLFDFRLFNKTDWNYSETQKLPRAVIEPSKEDSLAAVQGNNKFIALDKDCREELSFNYQINLLHKSQEGDEDFFTFPNLFGRKEEGKLKIALLDETQSLFNENQNIINANILADSVNGDIDYELLDSDVNSIEVRFTLNKEINLDKLKSIVLYQGDTQSGKVAYIIKNVSKLTNENKLQSWWIYPVFND